MYDRQESKSDLLEIIRKDEFYRESFELFCELHPAMDAQLREAAVNRDPQAIRNYSHVLKSRLRILGCLILGDDVEQIERQADALSLPELTHRIDSMLHCITAAIEQIDSIIADVEEQG